MFMSLVQTPGTWSRWLSKHKAKGTTEGLKSMRFASTVGTAENSPQALCNLCISDSGKRFSAFDAKIRTEQN